MKVIDTASVVIPRVVIALTLLIAVVGLGALTGLVKVYGVGEPSQNAGVVVGTDSHDVGFEWAGAPGFFVDNN